MFSFPTLPNFVTVTPAPYDDLAAYEPDPGAGSLGDLQSLIDALRKLGQSASDGSLGDAIDKMLAAQKRLDAMKASALRPVSETPARVAIAPAHGPGATSVLTPVNWPHLPPHFLQLLG
jgi:hypothetical protein